MTSQSNFDRRRGDDFEDLIKYPLLTQDVDDTHAPSGGRMGGGENARLVSQAIRGILGWQPRRSDPRGFVAALNGAFSIETVDGYTSWIWQPRAFSIDAGLGEITGAQATVYQQAQVSLREIEPLLDGLEPLVPDADEEDIYASREIIRSTLTSLVNELGVVGGPRVQKVDDYFEILIGSYDRNNPVDISPESVEGELGRLRDRLGLEFRFVNMLPEERVMTKFLGILNYISLLLIIWNQNRDYFTGKGMVFLGTHLVRISQALEVVASSVDQTRSALRSVLLSDADQQAIHLFEEDTSGQIATISLAGLLDWIEQAATLEWPHLIREGGNDGVVVIVPSLRRLADLVCKAAALTEESSSHIPEAFFSARVKSALKELEDHLVSAGNLAEDIASGPRFTSSRKSAATSTESVKTKVPRNVTDVTIEVIVQVPPGTTDERAVYLVGDFSELPESNHSWDLQDSYNQYALWDLSAKRMARIGDSDFWHCELTGPEGAQIRYRYLLEGKWIVGADDKGKDFFHREIQDQGDGRMTIQDTITRWEYPQDLHEQSREEGS